MHRKKTFLVLCLGFVSAWGIAQQAVSSSGGNAGGSGGSASYTIGQVSCSAVDGSGGSVIEGVQQPYEVTAISGVDEQNRSNLIFSVFPNPATDEIRLLIDGSFTKDYDYQLLNLDGKVILQERISDSETRIPVKSLTPSTYLMHILKNNKTISTYKIIKN